MKSTDLRIGNFIEEFCFEYGFNIIQVEAENFNSIIYHNDQEYDTHEGYFKPIPVTKEWLIKLGFEKDNQVNLYRLINNLGVVVYYPETTVEFSKFNFMVNGSSVMTNKLKYVHQLQNLYFALTNEELNYAI